MRGKKGHKKKIGLSAAIVFSLTLAGCGSSSKAFEKGKAPDYSVAESWVSLPAASENASDEAEKNFDVFQVFLPSPYVGCSFLIYIHPVDFPRDYWYNTGEQSWEVYDAQERNPDPPGGESRSGF